MCIQYLIILTVRTLFLQVGGITDTLPISVFTQKFKAGEGWGVLLDHVV